MYVGWSSELCLQSVEVGTCKGYFPRWFYNSTSDRCEMFIYGGCGGNLNSFGTRKNCEKACACGKLVHIVVFKFSHVWSMFVTDRCTFQPDSGLCRAYFPRYFYNTTSDSCERFIYGGCGGNDNRFITAAECTENCYSNCKWSKYLIHGTHPTGCVYNPDFNIYTNAINTQEQVV